MGSRLTLLKFYYRRTYVITRTTGMGFLIHHRRCTRTSQGGGHNRQNQGNKNETNSNQKIPTKIVGSTSTDRTE